MMQTTPIKIFLITPIDENQSEFGEKIVYSDNQESARMAASKSLYKMDELKHTRGDIYLDEGRSTCIETEADIIHIDKPSDTVKIKYRDVIYNLTKNVAKDVLSQSIF